jgi:pilus assembly protein CpaB
MNLARVIVLLVAVLAGGAAAYMFYQPSEQAPVAEAPKVEGPKVLIAKSDIPIGALVTAKELEWMPWAPNAPTGGFITQQGRPGAMEELKGSIARMAFVAGEPIREAKLIKGTGSGFMAAILPSGKRAMSFEISADTAAAGFILPNDYVDVLLTHQEERTEGKKRDSNVRTSVLLSDVRVLAIDQTIEEKGDSRVIVGKTATLELTPDEVNRLAAARRTGTLSLALRSLADANKPRTEGEAKGQRTEVNIIRFGVSSSNVVE